MCWQGPIAPPVSSSCLGPELTTQIGPPASRFLLTLKALTRAHRLTLSRLKLVNITHSVRFPRIGSGSVQHAACRMHRRPERASPSGSSLAFSVLLCDRTRRDVVRWIDGGPRATARPARSAPAVVSRFNFYGVWGTALAVASAPCSAHRVVTV
eukprot:6208137-Prymnesium_polylepis.1